MNDQFPGCQHSLPTCTATIQWRSIPALAERVNAGAKHPTLTEHALRHYVRFADRNGLHPHVRRLGRKILINEQGFLAWLSGDRQVDAKGEAA